MDNLKKEKSKNIRKQIVRIVLLLFFMAGHFIFVNLVRGLYLGGGFLVFYDNYLNYQLAPGYSMGGSIEGFLLWLLIFFFMVPVLCTDLLEIVMIILGVISRKKEIKKGFLQIYSIIMLVKEIVNLLTVPVYLIFGIIFTVFPGLEKVIMITGCGTISFVMAAGLFIWFLILLIFYLICFVIDRAEKKKTVEKQTV